MGKILLFVSFAVTLLAAALGFINKGKLSDAVAQAQSNAAQAATAHTQLAKKESDLKTMSKQFADLQATQSTTAGQISSLQSDLDKAKSQVTDLTTQNTTADANLKDAQAKVDSLTKQLADAIAAQTPAPPKQSTDDQAQIQEDKTLIANLQSKLDDSRTKLDAMQKEDLARKGHLMAAGTQGRILAVNSAWNFVVLSLGDKSGVVSNAELIVKRGSQMVGKVRVTSVMPSTSIADIVANSVPTGTSLSPGDQVIYPASTE